MSTDCHVMKLMVKHGQPCAAMCLQESGSRCGFMALRWLRCLIWSCFCNSSSSLTWWNWVYTLSHVFGVLGLGFLKLGKFFTRMLRLRMTLGSLVFRPIVRDFTLAAGIHSLFSSSLKPVKKKLPIFNAIHFHCLIQPQLVYQKFYIKSASISVLDMAWFVLYLYNVLVTLIVQFKWWEPGNICKSQV